jgi:hypothetical protein
MGVFSRNTAIASSVVGLLVVGIILYIFEDEPYEPQQEDLLWQTNYSWLEYVFWIVGICSFAAIFALVGEISNFLRRPLWVKLGSKKEYIDPLELIHTEQGKELF